MKNPENSDSQKFEQAALNHAWNWFEYHADQRLSLLRMFLITTGAVTAAYFAAFEAQLYPLSVGAALFGAVASFCFLRLDDRSSQLVKLGEAVLKREQESLKQIVKYDEIQIAQWSEQKKPGRVRSYREVLRILFGTVLLIYGLGVALAIYSMGNSFSAP